MKLPVKHILVFSAAIFFFSSCRKAQPFTEEEQDPRLSGGSQTTFNAGSSAFGEMFNGLSDYDARIHAIGDVAFGASFVTAPAHVNPGLGPIYNNIGCGNCHASDGRGAPPQGGKQLMTFLMRISVPGADEYGGPLGVPGFGGQLQTNATFGKSCEADLNISYANQTFTFPDGETALLRQPSYNLTQCYMPWPSNAMLSPRMAPPNFGLGLLENIGEQTMLSFADENDANGDGISGKANYVWNIREQRTTVGRFGWKCEAPDLVQQTAGAYNEDMGVTNYIKPKESSLGQTQYYDDGLKTEVSDSVFNAVVFYLRSLCVPARRNVTDANVKHGEQLFKQANCTGCHKQTIVTDVNVAFKQVSSQTIHPYTDLLLHDMGTGLADNRPTYRANGQEWRTAPLWGIGLTQVVNGGTNFLHDGRAHNLQEAILWHDGEARPSKDFYINLSKQDRKDMLSFLNSL